MLHRLILKVTKFQLPPPKRLSTVVKNILGGRHAPPPMSNRVKQADAVPDRRRPQANLHSEWAQGQVNSVGP